MKNVVIGVLLVLCGFLADRVVREENQRYALLLGMCWTPSVVDLPDFACLEKVQTRTGWIWHLYYAVTGDLPAVALSSP